MEIAGERIGHAIFVDAVLPQPGETHGDVVPLFDWRSVHDPVTDSLRIPDDSQERLKAELAPCDLPWVMARRTGFPRAPISEAVGLERFWQGGWPVTIVRCIQSENPPESRQRHAAARLNAEWCELSSGHFPFITCPDALARIIAGRSA